MNEKESWTQVIAPRFGWFDVNLKELWFYQDLIKLLVYRDLVAQYKQTILGPLWFVIQPLLSTAMFTIVFGRIGKIPTDGIPQFLFYFSGTVLWTYFSQSLQATSNTFIANSKMLGKVYFPRLCIPISIVITNIAMFLLQFFLFVGFFVYFKVRGSAVSWNMYTLLLPVHVFQMACLGLGFGILVSSLTTKYRDLTFLLTFGIQLWMYATPVVYPLSEVPEKFRYLLWLNPMTSIIEQFRYAFLGTSSVTSGLVISSWVITLFVLIGGVILFSRIEKTFMDTI